jgi:flagellar protein FliS
MDPSENKYLEAQIMTATPQKLRLMLIEGALRFARRTLELWEQSKPEEALESLIRCRSIVAELMSGIQADQSDLTRRVAAVYVFLFRCLTEAHLHRQPQRVQDTIRVLEIERDTWQQVCDQMPAAPVADQATGPTTRAPIEILAPAEGIGGPVKSEFLLDA